MNAAPVQVRVNGVEIDTVSAFDRGLHYGDGLFETMPVMNGKPIDLAAHLTRLHDGCVRLGIATPDPVQLTAEAEALCAGHARAVLKLIITRGLGGRGYRPGQAMSQTQLLAIYPWPAYPDCFGTSGIILRLCSTRLAIQRQLAGLKHLNRLEQVLARSEWDDPGIAEGLMLDTEGRVVEATQSNVFLVQDGQLLTPDLSRCGVRGIARQRIIQLASELGIACSERDVALDELALADEVFVCNSLIGIWPVQAFETHHYSPGPLTRRLQQSYRVAA